MAAAVLLAGSLWNMRGVAVGGLLDAGHGRHNRRRACSRAGLSDRAKAGELQQIHLDGEHDCTVAGFGVAKRLLWCDQQAFD